MAKPIKGENDKMRNVLIFYPLLFLLLVIQKANCQGLENFNNYSGSGSHYHNGTFTGQDGSTWTYKQCRSDRPIISPSPCLGKARDTTASVWSGTLHNGCGTFNFDYKQAYSTAVNLNVYVNGVKVCNVISPGGVGDTSNVHNSGPRIVNIPGDFVIKFIQADSTNSGQVTIDNISWTCDTALPEPTNYPTDFTATPGYFKVTLNWTDATGGQVPSSYLIVGSDANNIVPPTDGIPVADDPNLGDGSAAVNILPGVQTCLFTGLLSNTTYYFAIFPYTNSGEFIDYKTDSTAPAVNATTSNGVIIFHRDFNDFKLSPMTPWNIQGPGQFWMVDSTHGTSSSGCARMSGWANGLPFANEDWLITPAMNFELYKNEVFSFMSSYDYPGNSLSVKISDDYDGSGDPDNFNWTDLDSAWSPGGWVWTYSGDIDVSGTNGNGVHIGFTYTSDTTHASTWELDDILVIGTPVTGIKGISPKTDFTISPNPSNGLIRIVFDSEKVRRIKIMNLVGNEVYQEMTTLSTWNIDLADLSAGIYFVQIKDGLNKMPVLKLILQ
jgi:hypothetical protein